MSGLTEFYSGSNEPIVTPPNFNGWNIPLRNLDTRELDANRHGKEKWIQLSKSKKTSPL